ncbi:RNA-directed DNA polymerase, eukaryota [Tanacetum coccineum]
MLCCSLVSSSRLVVLDDLCVKSWFCKLLNAYNDLVSDNDVVGLDIKVSHHVWSLRNVCKIGNKWVEALDYRGYFGSAFALKRLIVMSSTMYECNVDGDFSKTIFSDNVDECNVDGHGKETDKHQSEDPFGFYDLLNKLPAKGVRDASTSLSHPPDMVNMPRVDAKVMDHSQEVHDSSNGESVSSFSHKVHNGGSILDILDDMVRVGHSMGYNLDGCLKDMERIIGSQGDEDDQFLALQDRQMDCISQWSKVPMGNSNFDFVASDSLGNSGGSLGFFLSNLVRRWNGEAIIMGDFNDVRTMDERLGSSFNVSSARCFDRFIVSSGLVDVKMGRVNRLLALCLDRHLSDHRPILLREVLSDFGPTPFRFYQSWLRMEGFDSMVEHAWLSFSHSDSNAFGIFGSGGVSLDRAVSRDEIRRAVWNCGENKSPGPDGYTFEFFRKYWSLVGADFCDAVDYFFKSGTFPRGCNSSFIALIPKVNDAKFFPETQSAFVANRQILAGPFNLNEMLNCGLRSTFLKSKSWVSGFLECCCEACEYNRMECCCFETSFSLSWFRRLVLREYVSEANSAWVGLVEQTPSPVPKGVLKTMESIRSKFFNGVDSSDRKISWVAWDNVLASN